MFLYFLVCFFIFFNLVIKNPIFNFLNSKINTINEFQKCSTRSVLQERYSYQNTLFNKAADWKRNS